MSALPAVPLVGLPAAESVRGDLSLEKIDPCFQLGILNDQFFGFLAYSLKCCFIEVWNKCFLYGV